MVAIDCWYQEGMCRRSAVQGIAFPVVYGHTAGQQILYSQGLREDELVGIYCTYAYTPLHQTTVILIYCYFDVIIIVQIMALSIKAQTEVPGSSQGITDWLKCV